MIRNHNFAQKAFRVHGGFTLLEILITTVLVFLLFTLIYATFFSVTNVTAGLQNKMRSSEVLLRFLARFSDEIKCMILDDGNRSLFSEKSFSFVTKETGVLYPVQVTYLIEKTADNHERLIRKQENLLSNYYFIFPVIENCDSISFLFYTGTTWDNSVIEVARTTAVAVEMEIDGEKIFFPVKLNKDTKKDDKK